MEKSTEEEEVEKAEFDPSEIEYINYGGEHHLPLIMHLVDQELSEPYSIFTYRYFVYLWPQLCFLAFHRGRCVGTVVCKMGEHRHTFRGYIAMLVVIKAYRGKGIATDLVTRSIKVMMESGCDEYKKIRIDQSSSWNEPQMTNPILGCCGGCCCFCCKLFISSLPQPLMHSVLKVTLEAEVTNKGALALYGGLGFIRAKRLFRYYLNGVDAFRLKLLFPRPELQPSLQTLAYKDEHDYQIPIEGCSTNCSKF